MNRTFFAPSHLPFFAGTILSFHITIKKKLLANTEHQYNYLTVIKPPRTQQKSHPMIRN